MKFSGNIGFWEGDKEISTDIWKPVITERFYTGDILEANRKFQPSDNQNDIFNINNRISIIADLYARNNWPSIKYVCWKGIKWKVSNVNENYPRLILQLGGVYNENTKGTETTPE